MTPAGLVEYINRFSLSSVEANGFTSGDFRVQFNRLKQKSEKPNYDFDAQDFAEFFVGESRQMNVKVLNPTKTQVIRVVQLNSPRIGNEYEFDSIGN